MLCENHFYKWGKEGIKPLQKYRHFHKVSNEKEDISFKEFLENLWVLSILQEFSWDGNRSKALFMHSETLHIIRKRWEVYEINEVRVRIWQDHKWHVFQCSRAQEKRKEHIGGGQEVVTGESHWKLKDTYDFARKGSGRVAPPPTTV